MSSVSASSPTHETLATSNRQTAPNHKSWLARSRAWISILLLTPAVIAVLFTQLHFQLESVGETVCTVAGYLLFVAGFAWRWWATLYIGGIKDQKLVQHGPYSMCRNPLYFGTCLMTLSIALVMQSATLGIAMLVVSLFYLGVTVANEESRLEGWLGTEYRDYKARVPRFLPRFSLYQSQAVLTVPVSGLHAEAKRTLQYVCIPLICHGLLHLRAHDWWPNLIWLP